MIIYNNGKGVTLIEMMIAVMLSFIVSSIAWAIYFSTVKAYRFQQSLSAIEQQATTAASLLHYDIGLAGYIGCARLTSDFPIITHTNESITNDNKLMVTESSVTVRHAAFPAATLSESNADKVSFQADLGQRFKEGQILVISDCQHAEIVKAVSISRHDPYQTIEIETPLRYSYKSGAEISRLEINRYYFIDDKLMLQTMDGRDLQMVEGIKEMKVTRNDRKGVNIELIVSAHSIEKPWSIYAPLPS